MSEQEKYGLPPQAPQRAREGAKNVGEWALRSVSRFAALQPMHDSLEYSEATGRNILAKSKNMLGAGLMGIVFPAATALAQSSWGESKLGKAGVVAMGVGDLFAWGGGGLSILTLTPFVPTAIWRLAAVGLSEMLPRRKAVQETGLRRGL